MIGAGSSGLAAARTLADSVSVLVLEARDRSGGRITRERMGEVWLDRGAHWVHNCVTDHELLQEVRRLGLPLAQFEDDTEFRDEKTGEAISQADLDLASHWAQHVWREAALLDVDKNLSVSEAAVHILEEAQAQLTPLQFRALQE